MLVSQLNELPKQDRAKIVEALLPLVARSIKVEYRGGGPHNFMNTKGYGDSLGTNSWASRSSNWYRNGMGTLAYMTTADVFMEAGEVTRGTCTEVIPVFEQQLKRAIKTANINLNNPKKEQKQVKNFKDTAIKVTNVNKEAGSIVAKMGTGKGLNNFFLNKLASKMPWYAKLFGGKKNVVENPLAKLVTAELAVTLANHFSPDNKKLKYATEGMLQDAIYQSSVNTDTFEQLLKELEDLVPDLPDFGE